METPAKTPNGRLTPLQEQFLAHILDCGVLRFGEFKTKSGRLSPYFFEAGRFDSGLKLAKLAAIYAEALTEYFADDAIDNLYGPAYKGIPLAVACAEAWAHRRGHDVGYTFNRKEIKDHGEGGRFVGQPYPAHAAPDAPAQAVRTVIIEDVITGGTSIRESVPLLRAAGATVVGALVGVDREERGLGAELASAELRSQFQIKIHAVLGLSAIVDHLTARSFLGKVWIDEATRARIDTYRAAHGKAH